MIITFDTVYLFSDFLRTLSALDLVSGFDMYANSTPVGSLGYIDVATLEHMTYTIQIKG